MSSSKIFKHYEPVKVESTPFKLKFIYSGADQVREYLEDSDENVGTGTEAVEKEAYERGFAAGEKAGFEFGRKKAEVTFSGLARILEDLATFKESLYRPCEQEMAALSLAIAKKVIRKNIESDQNLIIDCLKIALKSVVAGSEIVIKVNPKDLEAVQQNKAELTNYTEGVKGLRIEADESVMKGGCRVDTNFGEIDATISSALAEIEERLKDAR